MKSEWPLVPTWETREREARDETSGAMRTFACQPCRASQYVFLLDAHRSVVCGVMSWHTAPWTSQ